MDLTPEEEVKLRRLLDATDDLILIKNDKKAFELVGAKMRGHALWIISIIGVLTLLWDKFKLAIGNAIGS